MTSHKTCLEYCLGLLSPLFCSKSKEVKKKKKKEVFWDCHTNPCLLLWDQETCYFHDSTMTAGECCGEVRRGHPLIHQPRFQLTWIIHYMLNLILKILNVHQGGLNRNRLMVPFNAFHCIQSNILHPFQFNCSNREKNPFSVAFVCVWYCRALDVEHKNLL